MRLIFTLGIYIYFIRRNIRLKAERIELQQLRMQSLQGQMNPHFIFNALNAIQSHIMQNNKLEAMEYIGEFAALIRTVLTLLNNLLFP